MKNIISIENLTTKTLSSMKDLIQASTEMNGCSITNVIQDDIKSIWLSNESLPQEIIINLNTKNLIHYPKKLAAIGIFCFHPYPTNPKSIEILISNKNKNQKNKNSEYSLGQFDLCLKSGLQLLQIDEDLLVKNEKNELSDDIKIKIIIKETFGGKRTYINCLYLLEELDINALKLNSIEEVNEEDNNSSMAYIKEKKNKNTDKIKNNYNNINNSIRSNFPLMTSEILISESELSGKKNLVDNNRLNTNKNLIINNRSKIIDTNENAKKIDDNNIINSNTKSMKNITPTNLDNKINYYENKMTPLKNTSNKENKSSLITDVMKSPDNLLLNEFLASDNKTKFHLSCAELSNIEAINENSVLITEFKSYKKTQEEKVKIIENKIANIESQMITIITRFNEIKNNLSAILLKEDNKSLKNEILDECKKLINESIIKINESKNINQNDQNTFSLFQTQKNNFYTQNGSKINNYQNIISTDKKNYMTHEPFYTNQQKIMNKKKNKEIFYTNISDIELYDKYHKNNKNDNISNISENDLTINKNNYFSNKPPSATLRINNIDINNFNEKTQKFLNKNLIGNFSSTPEMKITSYLSKEIPQSFRKKNLNNKSTINNSNKNNNISGIPSNKRQNSYRSVRNNKSKTDIEKEIDLHLKQKFADFSSRLGQNISENILKPSIEKLQNIMQGNLNEVENSLRKAEKRSRSKYKK